uniref:Cupin 2 conserved barrel domain protein n=1 Tax=Gloeothece verrucosa (strain PCC 7822) TaxID=497965 RepID=E0UIB8_GLOV7|nr:Cupin 2 conserved barrel domain protein [Gloeothece verrucosa PCC 7822]
MTTVVFFALYLVNPSVKANTIPILNIASDPALNLKSDSTIKKFSDTEGPAVWAMGVLVTLKLQGKDSGGAYSIFEDFIPPGVGTPLHIHTREEEFWYVLEGQLTWNVGDKLFQATQGDFINTPRGVPHRFQNSGNKPARMLLGYSPAGFEQWFLDVGKPVSDRKAQPPKITPQDIEKAVAAAKEYGVNFVKQ